MNRLHGLSRSNRKMLEVSGHAGCFSCVKSYPADQIKDWTDGNQTALCPCCGIDAVIPIVNMPVLEALKAEYFAPPSFGRSIDMPTDQSGEVVFLDINQTGETDE